MSHFCILFVGSSLIVSENAGAQLDWNLSHSFMQRLDVAFHILSTCCRVLYCRAQNVHLSRCEMAEVGFCRTFEFCGRSLTCLSGFCSEVRSWWRTVCSVDGKHQADHGFNNTCMQNTTNHTPRHWRRTLDVGQKSEKRTSRILEQGTLERRDPEINRIMNEVYQLASLHIVFTSSRLSFLCSVCPLL